MKVCNKCLTEKSLDEFHRKGSGHQSMCKECRRSYHRAHYLANKETYIQQSSDYKQLLQAEVAFIKEANPCTDCGIFHPACVMDFDHVDDNKEAAVGDLTRRGNRAKIIAEMQKCELVCSNCHRIRTHNRRSLQH